MSFICSNKPLFSNQVMESAQGPANGGMDEENVLNTYNDVLFFHKEEWNYAMNRKMNRTRNHCVDGIRQSL